VFARWDARSEAGQQAYGGGDELKNETIQNLAIARRIRDAGCPIHIEEDDGEPRSIPSDGLLVYQFGGQVESSAIDCSCGICFVIYLVITMRISNFAISAFGLELPWTNDSFCWLEDPREIGDSSDCYRFGDRYIPDFDRQRALNHYADVRRVYSRGTSLKGCLLGRELNCMPAEIRHGMMIPAFVVIYDQFLRKHRSPVELRADRSCVRSRTPRKVGLFDRRDPVALGRKQ
jgi:hypothetical protein